MPEKSAVMATTSKRFAFLSKFTSSSMKSSGPRMVLSALFCRDDTKAEGVHPLNRVNILSNEL